jgi:hypothetical protein
MEAEQTLPSPEPLAPESDVPPPTTYKVARSRPGEETLNTIDIIGEHPFSV